MAIRNRIRGTLDWEELERIFAVFAERHDLDVARVRFVEADNWLSIPAVVDEEWFVKVITPQNSLVHAVFTVGRNLGSVSRGHDRFFEHYESPLAMAEHELAAMERMAAAGIDAPEPVEAFEVDGYGVLVMEYLPDFRTLGELDDDELAALAPDLFDRLRALHAEGLAHGDLRAENVLLSGDRLYFIDATKIKEDEELVPDASTDALAYDLACALAMLAPRIGARRAVETAVEEYEPGELVAALEFLDFVALRPDHDFDVTAVKGAIEEAAA